MTVSCATTTEPIRKETTLIKPKKPPIVIKKQKETPLKTNFDIIMVEGNTCLTPSSLKDLINNNQNIKKDRDELKLINEYLINVLKKEGYEIIR